MVTTPYQISGTVYDVDGSIAIANIVLKLKNLRTNENAFTTSDSNGEYIYDLANLSSGYRNDDSIFIEAYLLTDTVKRYTSETITVDTSIGYTSQDFTLSGANEEYIITTKKEEIEQRVFDVIDNAIRSKVILPPALLNCDSTLLRTTDYYAMVAEDKIDKHNRGSAIGANTSIGTAGFAILSNVAVTQPTDNVQMQVVSDSADDADGGTGANQVTIKYLPKAWSDEYSTETVTMNGTNTVNTTAKDIYRIEEFYVNKTGGNGLGVGVITLKSTDAGTLYAQIDAGRNFFERAIHYLRTGYRTMVTDVVLGCSSNGGVTWRLFRSMEDSDGNVVPRGRLSIEVADNTMQQSWNIPVGSTNPNGKRLAIGLAVKGINANQKGTASFRYYDEMCDV